MAKVTSRRRVTIPKEIAAHYGVRPGDEVRWVPAGDTLFLTFPGRRAIQLSVEERPDIFDRATERQIQRQQGRVPAEAPEDRSWRREDLNNRGPRST